MLENRKISFVSIEPGYRLKDLARVDPIPRMCAFDPETLETYLVLSREGEPAGEFEYDNGATVAEWFDCDPDETVFSAISIKDAQEKPDRISTLEDVARAVKSSRLLPCNMPSSRLAPLPESLDLSEIERR